MPSSYEQMLKGPLPMDHAGARPSNVNGRPRQSTMHQVGFSLHAGSGGTRAVEGFGPSAKIRENLNKTERGRKRPSDEFQPEDIQAAKRRQSSTPPGKEEVAQSLESSNRP